MSELLSYSRLRTLSECPRKFQLSYEQGWESAEGSVLLVAGRAGHAALHTLYTQGFSALGPAVDAANEIWEAEAPPVLPPRLSYLTFEHLAEVIRLYAEERADDGWEVMPHAEEMISMQMGRHLYRGLVDLPVKISGIQYVVDHKFTSGSVTPYWAAIQGRLSHQGRSYMLLLRSLGFEPQGVIINGVSMGKNALDTAAQFKKRTSVRSGWFGPFNFSAEHLLETSEWIHSRALEIERRREALDWPQNDRACSGCGFFEVCVSHPRSRERELERNFVQVERT